MIIFRKDLSNKFTTVSFEEKSDFSVSRKKPSANQITESLNELYSELNSYRVRRERAMRESIEYVKSYSCK